MSTFLSKQIIEEVAQIKGISEAFVEKDWFVTRVIKLITSTNFQDFELVFTGGTALSKAHRLIQRFSEDIDFRVIAPILSKQSRNQQSKTLSEFKKSVVDSLSSEFFISDDQITARNENRFIAIELNYHTLFGRTDTLRPHILLELTVSDLAMPVISQPVSSFINEVALRPPEIGEISCIDPVENAADKLSAVTWRIPDRRHNTVRDDPDVVRHIHDLAILSEKALRHPAFPELAKAAIKRDDKRSKSVTGLLLSEKLNNMLNILEEDSEYSKEYRRFVLGMSYAPEGSTPSFVEALEKLHFLVERVLKK